MNKEQRAKIDYAVNFCRVKNCTGCPMYDIGGCLTLVEYMRELKQQAVKEFAERLKIRFYNLEYSAIAIDNKIDELVKEYEK